MIHVLVIPNWHPHSKNKWSGKHWSVRSKLKKEDADLIGTYAKKHDLPKAVGRRRVILEVVFPKSHRGRKPDPANFWESLLDGLKHAGMITDDNIQGVEQGQVYFRDGDVRKTRIFLEDIE